MARLVVYLLATKFTAMLLPKCALFSQCMTVLTASQSLDATALTARKISTALRLLAQHALVAKFASNTLRQTCAVLAQLLHAKIIRRFILLFIVGIGKVMRYKQL
jgi:hypothetical protein